MATGEEKTAHAPWLAGDCMACHVPAPAMTGQPANEAQGRMGLIRPVNDHCVSCHKELFRRPPTGHPPEQAFCASCHEPHASRNRALLRDDDTTRACLDYAPPYPQKPKEPPRAVPARVRGL